MSITIKTIAVSSLLLVSLVGCGVGDHDPIPGSGAGSANSVTGVAATGAPISGKVTLKDSSISTVELTTSTASDGTFAFNIENLTAPFIIRTTSGGKTFYSIATGNGTANINPLTTIVVSVAAGGADLDAFFASVTPDTLKTLVSKLSSAEIAVKTAFAPILDIFGVTATKIDSFSIINSLYVADHTGIDAMFDVIDFKLSGGVITLTNKINSTVIFTALASAIANGKVALGNIPAVPVLTLGAKLYKANCSVCHGDISNSTLIGRNTYDKIVAAINANIGGMSSLSSLTFEEIRAINDAIPTQAVTPPTPPGTTSGAALYNTNCSSCHGPLATSTKLGATSTRIQNAIAAVPQMTSLSSLTAADIQAIVVALNPTPTTPPPVTPTPDGATLYTTNCSACHGPLATSTKKGLTIARFYNAVTSNSTTGMGYLASLSIAEIQAIISVLPPVAPLPGTSPGQILYDANCATCHNPFASSTKGGATATRILTGITTVTQMSTLSSLTVGDIESIAAALATVAPPPVPVDGAGLYAANCASCHGPLATSTKGGKSAVTISAAITSVAQMNSLSTLTASQVASIATALATVIPTIPTDGPGLYGLYCAGCHNPLATSSKGGATVAKISAAIASNRGTMGSLSSLTTTQRTLISNALASIAPPACGSCHSVVLKDLTSGRHNFHGTQPDPIDLAQFTASTSCGICHGAGYTTSSNGNLLTHNDGIKTITTVTTTNARINGLIHWTPPVLSSTGTVTTRGTCSPACHGQESW